MRFVVELCGVGLEDLFEVGHIQVVRGGSSVALGSDSTGSTLR